MQEPRPPEPVRALIGFSIKHLPFVMATDSRSVKWDCEEISECCEDLGIDYCDSETGFCLFDGTVEIKTYGSPAGEFEPDVVYEVVYEGKARPVELHELPVLLAMKPPPGPEDEERDGPVHA